MVWRQQGEYSEAGKSKPSSESNWDSLAGLEISC